MVLDSLGQQPTGGTAGGEPAAGPSCTDPGAIARDAPSLFFYQVRAFCAPAEEGL